MKDTIFNKNDSVLLLGEGNFSFAVSLSQLNIGIKITATCYESTVQTTGKKNIEYLIKHGVRVLLGIDATSLANSILNSELFDKIIFNFPHVGGKMRIEKNRELLKLFFVSAGSLLESNGCVLVTLCNGQGGTVADNPKRRWDDSWKITEMAAHGDFVLTSIEPFLWSMFTDYVVTGYRSLEKSFHSEGALIHIFKKSIAPNVTNIANECKIVEYFNCENSASASAWEDLIATVKNQVLSDLNWQYSHTHMFDITLCTDRDFLNANLYIALYNHAGKIIKNVELIDTYRIESESKEMRTYRISYSSSTLPLYRERVISIHHNLITNIIERNLNVTVPK